ncbi:hypothetical protein [Senegalia sp. (in: firmicutes)]|uniref:hypothetical protein n=1 Tax=Senegalia sp. (in: firmicutes) TaxID=1924098 RepID=UPI003F9B6CE3
MSIMTKEMFVIKIEKELDKKFRDEVEKQGKLYNLSLEEAMKLWLKEVEKKEND